ncbi:hypothetical protein [Ramlibacter sp.]
MSSGSQRDATSETAVPENARQQLARSIDWMAAAFRAGESIQQAQLQMSQRAALLHSQAADNVRKASTPLELMQIQSTLLMYEWQEATRYTQELFLACTKALAQPAANGSGMQSAATSASATGGMPDAGMGMAAPMMQAWQQIFSASLVPDGAQQKH